ncbi:MAG TPA: response regulator [Verrucomicrobiota bacterium]|nr:response regulator [Verrucomicrobiota bacterium]HNU53223.1 response regulator [Verrucomicrobiota bacterium]
MGLFKPVSLYLAIRKEGERSATEDSLVLDGFDPSSFSSAAALWARFQERPARMVITDRRFGDDFTGIDLTRAIRTKFALPYVFVVVMSSLSRLNEIEEGLAAGVDDYLIKPHNRFQLRSRIAVGLRWLTYIDSLHAQAGNQSEPKAPVGKRAASSPRRV